MAVDPQQSDDGSSAELIDADTDIVDNTAAGKGWATSRIAASWRYCGCGIGVGTLQTKVATECLS